MTNAETDLDSKGRPHWNRVASNLGLRVLANLIIWGAIFYFFGPMSEQWFMFIIIIGLSSIGASLDSIAYLLAGRKYD